VRFVVRVDGTLSDIKIIHGVHPVLDAEALRAINQSGKWIPAKKQGRIVPVWITFPVNFQLSDNVNKQVTDSTFKYSVSYSRPKDSIFNKESSKSEKMELSEQLEYYMYESFTLGWFNSDAFRGLPTVNQTITAEGIGKISIYALMTKFRILLTGYKRNNHFIINNIPLNDPFIAIAIKKIGDKVYLAKKKAAISSHPIVLDDFKEIKLEDLGKEIAEIKKEK
jgi:TonB family protein